MLALFKLAVLSSLLTAPCIAQAQALSTQEKQHLLDRMNAVYYNLQNQNFKGMQCGMDVDYASFFANLPETKEHPEKLAELNKTLATMTTQVAVGADGHAKVTTSGIDSSKMGVALDSTTTGVNQAFQGFFLGWAGFALGKPFPYRAADVDIRPVSDGYVMTRTDSGTTAETYFSKDLVLQRMNIDSSRVSIAEDLAFLPLPSGLVLSGFKAQMQLKPSGTMPETEINATYQQMNGLELPHTFTIRIEGPGLPPIVGTLKDCKLN